MSRSNAAAINRRVNIPAAQSNSNLKPGQPVPGSVQTTNKPVSAPAQQTGFTLPQAISVIDNRLVALEKFMRETQNNQLSTIQYKIQETTQSVDPSIKHDFINHMVEEFNERFSIFAQEISEMKDIVLKLQTYTMDVNKTLLEERIQVFSDLNSPVETITPETNLVTLTSTDSELNANNNSENLSTEESNTSIDLKNLIKQEFSQSEVARL